MTDDSESRHGHGSRAASDESSSLQGGVIDPLLTALTLVYINTTLTARSSWPNISIPDVLLTLERLPQSV